MVGSHTHGALRPRLKQATLVMGVVLAVLLSGGARAESGGWREVAPMPDPRWFHTAGVGSDGKIYVYGGYVRNDNSLREYGLGKWSLVIFDPTTNTWARGPGVSDYRLRVRFRGVKTRILPNNKAVDELEWLDREDVSRVPHELFSGEADPFGKVHWFNITGLGAVFFDPKENSWKQQPSPVILADNPEWTVKDLRTDIPSRRAEGSFPAYRRTVATTATSPDGKIYVIGGTGDPIAPWERRLQFSLLAAVDVYDMTTNTWKTIAPLHHARQLHAAAFGADGNLYVFGGYAGEGGYQHHPEDPDDQAKAEAARRAAMTSVASVEMYDPTRDAWTERAPMPRPRQEAGAALGADGRIYVVGGTYSYMSPLPVDDVDIYDPRTDRWSRAPSLRHPRRAHAVVVTSEGRIYAIGGHVIRSGLSAWLPSPVESFGRDLRATVEVLETKPSP